MGHYTGFLAHDTMRTMKKNARTKRPDTRKNSWEQKQARNWCRNAKFWIRIIRANLDPFRASLTDKTILKAIPIKPGNVMDAGCGEGYLSRLLAKKRARVFGIDTTPELLAAAQNLEEQHPLGIHYSLKDIRKTGFPSSFFDIVVSHQSIQEIANPERAIGEFARVLKNKGKLLLLFLHPCFDFQEKTRFIDLYFQRTKIQKPHFLVKGVKSPNPYSYLHLPLEEWMHILQDKGFAILDVKEPHPSAHLLKRRWWRENFDYPRIIFLVAEKK